MKTWINKKQGFKSSPQKPRGASEGGRLSDKKLDSFPEATTDVSCTFSPEEIGGKNALLSNDNTCAESAQFGRFVATLQMNPKGLTEFSLAVLRDGCISIGVTMI